MILAYNAMAYDDMLLISMMKASTCYFLGFLLYIQQKYVYTKTSSAPGWLKKRSKTEGLVLLISNNLVFLPECHAVDPRWTGMLQCPAHSAKATTLFESFCVWCCATASRTSSHFFCASFNKSWSGWASPCIACCIARSNCFCSSPSCWSRCGWSPPRHSDPCGWWGCPPSSSWTSRKQEFGWIQWKYLIKSIFPPLNC